MKTTLRLFTLFVAVLLLSTAPVHAAPLLQDDRPPLPGEGEEGGDEGESGDGSETGDVRCAAVTGEVINWGFGPQGGVGIQLKTGSWELTTTSASDGRYGLGGLGVGVARLEVLLASGDPLQPLIQNAGVYLNCDYPTIANVALFSGEEITPPVTLHMSAPARTAPQVRLQVTVNNGLPTPISNVIITDLLPPGLVVQNMATSTGSPEAARIIDAGADGQMALAYLDTLAAGATADVFITVAAAENAPANSQVTNTATLFYRESVAHQASLNLAINRDGSLTPAELPQPVAAMSQAEATAAPAASPTPAATEEAAATPAPTTEPAGEEFVPPDDLPTSGQDQLPPPLLPTTGYAVLPDTGLGLVLPLSGVGLAGLAFLVHHLRRSDR